VSGNGAELAPRLGISALVAAAIGRALPPVLDLALGSDRLPQWDMAKYGASGLRLAHAIRDLNPLGFLDHLNALDVWPPLFPLLEAPVFLIFGPGYGSARAFVAVLFVLLVAAAMWAGAQAGGDVNGLMVGALTAAFVVTSPMYHLFATLVMLEIPGALILATAIGWYLRSLRSGRSRDFATASLLATALFFCKYNYGVMWLLPLAANEILRAARSQRRRPRELVADAVEFLRRPGPAFVAAWLVLTVILVFTGPWKFAVADRVIHIGSSANSVYALYVLVLASWAVRPRSSLQRIRAFLDRAGPRTRTMVGLIALPIAMWMVIPAHTINFIRFMENRSSGLPPLSVESLLYYPRSFVTSYSPGAVVGIPVLVL
jgi:hypothetical protein